MKTEAIQRVDAHIAVSVSDLKKSPSAVIEGAAGETVAVLNHNRVMAYLVAPAIYEAMLERLDDLNLVDMIRDRGGETPVRVSLDAL